MKVIREYFIVVVILIVILLISSLYVDINKSEISTSNAFLITINKISGDTLFLLAPYALATVEHTFDINAIPSQGDCRISNIINTPTGFLVSGFAINDKSKREPHIRGYTLDYRPIDLACPPELCTMKLEDIKFTVMVNGYDIVDKKFYKHDIGTYWNYIYTYTALKIQKVKHTIRNTLS